MLAGIAVSLSLLGCTPATKQPHFAPVIDAWHQPVSKQGTHTVQKGETLYEIAWRYGFDYREIAGINHIAAPYSIRTGQKLYLVSPPNTVKTGSSTKLAPHTSLNVKKADSTRTKPSSKLSDDHKPNKVAPVPQKLVWQWPVKGKIIKHFSAAGLSNKGIDITNTPGTPVLASAGGEVVYSGNGLLNYGNLLIIKHNGDYLSAYAHNRVNLVSEGMTVKAGQKIAEMGSTGGAKQSMLHFEIRRAGKPVDPLLYLH